jgi:ABC-type transport system involved in cytochrome bd biosynthesis fused ATPase/permease subunit
MLPLLISIAAFGTFVRVGNTLDVATVFQALALFNALQLPMIDLPSGFSMLVQAAVASGRLTAFMEQPDVSEVLHTADASSEAAMEIAGGEFRWSPDAKEPTLSDINFRAPRGKLTAVIGKVGSGKTSLLSALLVSGPALPSAGATVL